MELPEAFIRQRKADLGNESAAFFAALAAPAPVSFRLNPSKPIENDSSENYVPWCDLGRYLSRRPVFTLDPHFHAGAYYVQEAASMIIGRVISNLTSGASSLLALDMCAAPGGKSTLLADYLPDGSFLVANEVIKSRYRILEENLSKWGIANLATTNQDSKRFQPIKGLFEVVLVDAPCSGEGLFRKDPQAIGEWSLANVDLCAARQKRILANSVPLLAPGGLLIYSTCTYNRSENEENAQWLLDNFDLEAVNPDLQPEWNITEKSLGYQLYPHRNDSEGLYFFCARYTGSQNARKLRDSPARNFVQLPKKHWPLINPWLKTPQKWRYYQNAQGRIYAIHKQWQQRITPNVSVLQPGKIGLDLGTLKRNDFIPSPQLALSPVLNDSGIPRVELDHRQALSFLKKETPAVAAVPRGWALAVFEGNALGWMKGLGSRINNYYPKEWRIRMDINPQK